MNVMLRAGLLAVLSVVASLGAARAAETVSIAGSATAALTLSPVAASAG